LAYVPIQNYGMIGNMRTAALISPGASIDWMCLPNFDSPSVFGAILDDQKAGRFKISIADDRAVSRQFYWPDTNVLITHFQGQSGSMEVVDFMPVGVAKHGHTTPDLIRIVRPVHGRVEYNVEVSPAFDYARRPHSVILHEHGAIIESGPEAIALSSTRPLTVGKKGLEGRFATSHGEVDCFAIWHREQEEERPPVDLQSPQALEILEQTIKYWRDWLGKCTYQGRWREMVRRSALALKMLTYEPTGAIIAAPTTSLPELIGGTRNWDYRFTWLRDAAFTIYALHRIGYSSEATAFFGWLEQRCHEREPGGLLQPCYSIHGGHELPEEELGHLEGYMGSKPVRIGNAASKQLQLDAFGALLDGVYLHNKYAVPISYDLWKQLRELLDSVAATWKEKDRGIWEVRGEPKDFVYSKLMCWVTLDRGIRIAQARSFPANLSGWREQRDLIYDTIMQHGWSEKRRAFVQYFGADTLDAANLLMSLVLFLGPSDPLVLRTIDAIAKSPAEGGLLQDFLVYRYNFKETDDGLGQPEGGFNMCTFWLIEALTRAGKTNPARLEHARTLFECMLGSASPLGLYAEQNEFGGQALGNYPQALTHLSLISAAYGLDKVLGSR
jgi:GH15 family glucan-1,4-alpha-glucosidase